MTSTPSQTGAFPRSAKLGVGVCAVADDADAIHITIVHTHRVKLAGGGRAGAGLETIENAKNANGAELGPVLETIENALRADQAKLIAD